MLPKPAAIATSVTVSRVSDSRLLAKSNLLGLKILHRRDAVFGKEDAAQMAVRNSEHCRQLPKSCGRPGSLLP